LALLDERRRHERRLLAQRDGAQAALIEAMRLHGFIDAAAYAAALLGEGELASAAGLLASYEREGERLAADAARLEDETAGKEKPDMDMLTAAAEAAAAASAELRAKRDATRSRLEHVERARGELLQSAGRFSRLEKLYASARQMSDVANGKLDFETYAQMAYFERVLHSANQRLRVMSQERYHLLRKAGSDDGRKRSGLDLEVMDAYTGKSRSANSLSGGESFMASLSLALGLSDVVQQSAGGVQMGAMFIDEGFGSLDADVLELAVKTLTSMAGGGRVIGIISHVAELRERIDRQVRVEKTPAGSRIVMG
jgi:exonuclease SbcC